MAIIRAAAGNYGANNDSVKIYPASYTTTNVKLIAVAAHTQTNTLASFSNYGAPRWISPLRERMFTRPCPQNLAGTVTAWSDRGSRQLCLDRDPIAGTTSPSGASSGTIYDCGIGNTGQFPTGVSGNIRTD